MTTKQSPNTTQVHLSSMADVQACVSAWLAEYGAEQVSVAHLLCDRHAEDPERIALRYEDSAGNRTTLSFAELRDYSARMATVLRDLGVGKGHRVAVLVPKSPELVIALIAIWRLGAAHVPLFTAFGPQAVGYRLQHSAASVIITDTANRAKVGAPPACKVVTIEGPQGQTGEPGDTPFWKSVNGAVGVEGSTSVCGDDLLELVYTSGTTGSPKGVETPVRALAAFEAYMRFALDVRDDDVFWNMADPGWAYGLYYGTIGPLLLGKSILYYNAPFEPRAIYRVLVDYGVTNFAAAPTAYRSMRALGEVPDLTSRLRLRAASSAGEPLNPEVISWAKDALGVTIHDHWGQTEVGMVVVNAHLPALERPIRPGSMGHAMPGFRAVIVDESGRELEAGQEGEMAFDTQNSPLYYFRGYHKDPQRTAERFVGDGRYFLTGDAASRDADDYFFFSGRADDIISSAGYRIGPFDVESTIMQHKAVAEAAAVGKPDELRGEIVKAFVVLKPGYAPSEELSDELSSFVKSALSAHAYPREIEFVDELPKTPSGKVQRFLLRAR